MIQVNPSTMASRITARRRLRSVVKYGLATLALVCVLAAISFWVMTRSWFMVWYITPELQRKLGGDVTIEQADYQGGGRIVFTGVTLRARGIRGEAGQVAKFDRVAVAVDLSHPIRWGARIASIDLDGALIRVSEDSHEGGQLNFAALSPEWSRRSIQDAPPLPRISIRNTAIEFGWHDDTTFHRMEQLLVVGEMNPTVGSQKLFTFQLSETDPRGVVLVGGITMKGELNADTNEWSSRLDGLELDRRIRDMAPRMVQLLWDRMDLKGRVDHVIMNWNPDNSFLLTLDIDNVDLTLPVETNIQWARYRDGAIEETSPRPRMHFNGGVIRMTASTLELSGLTGRLEGTDSHEPIVSVPYKISFSLSQLPTLEWDQREVWMDRVLKFAPFTLSYSTENLRLQRTVAGQAPAVDLPHFVANVLERFRISDWLLTTSLEVTRGEAPRDAAGELVEVTPQVNGKAYLHQAKGRYEKFPYQLEDVDAYLQFDNDRVIVHSLTGRGSGNSRLRLSGEITPPGNDAAVALRLTGTDVPVDARLRDALHGHELEAYDLMFNRKAHDSLAAAGLIPDAAAIERANAELAKATNQLEGLRAPDRTPAADDAVNISDLEHTIARLRRFVDAGPFQLGGIVNLDLRIDREAGPERKTITTGTIGVHNVGLLYKEFPYPLRGTGGTLEWLADRVKIMPGPNGSGLMLVTPGGGHGTVTGELVIAETVDGTQLRPNLTIDIADDAFNDAVYAAIPLTAEEAAAAPANAEWPGGVHSGAAQLLQGVGLKGAAAYHGVIRAGEAGHIGYDFQLTLQKCTAQPTSRLAHAVGARDELWPPAYTLRDVAGSLRVTQDSIVADNITGRSDTGTLTVNGQVNQSRGLLENAFTIDIENLPLGPYVLNLVSETQATNAVELWNRYQPEGAFDARLEYRSTADQPTSVAIDVRPRTVSLQLDEQRVQLTRTDGQLRLHDNVIDLQRLTLDVADEHGVSDGAVDLNGAFSTREGAESLALQGRWSNGRLEATAVDHVLGLVASPTLIESYEQCRPSGLFDADFSITSSQGNAPAWWVSLAPRILRMQWNDRTVLASFDEGVVAFESDGIEVRNLRGRHSDGDFLINGSVATIYPIDAKLRVSHTGNVRSGFCEAILPPIVLDTMQSIDFQDAGHTVIDDANLRITQVEGADPDLRVEFNGPVRTSAASFDAGVKFTGVAGDFHFDLLHEPGLPMKFAGSATIARARSIGQLLTNGEATFGLNAEGTVIELSVFRADAGLGVITAQASAETREHGDYTATIDMVDVPVDRFSATDEPLSASEIDPPVSKKSGGLYGSLSLSGTLGRPETRRGRGMVRIVGGTAMSIPLLMQVVQTAQLTVPFGGDLDFGEAQMYIDGDQVVFERILFENNLNTMNLFQLTGEGTMNFNSLELNTRFRSRGSVPIVREIMGEIGDMLYTIEVTGTLNKPKARLVPLP